MMTFGFSGSPTLRRAEREIISGSNWLRAEKLADLVADYQVIIRKVIRGQVCSFPNAAFEGTIIAGYTYPRDWVATLQALIRLLRSDTSLMAAAEAQGVTMEGIQDMIERIGESSVTKTRKRRRLDA